MTNTSRQIRLAQDAYAKGNDALNLLVEAARLSASEADAPPPSIRTHLIRAMNDLTAYCETLDARRKAMRERFRDIPLLQATFACGGRTVRVAVAKPLDEIDEPWITETTRDALERRLGATKDEPMRSMEAFPVLVIGRSGKVVTEIPNH